MVETFDCENVWRNQMPEIVSLLDNRGEVKSAFQVDHVFVDIRPHNKRACPIKIWIYETAFDIYVGDLSAVGDIDISSISYIDVLKSVFRGDIKIERGIFLGIEVFRSVSIKCEDNLEIGSVQNFIPFFNKSLCAVDPIYFNPY
ncbi:hypothetical protein [Brevundimonas sp.]|uniref:hypothetical protein n=1 Tax=Brevundimonas sp. TaxID=1871086 RepID=UPI0035619CFB